MTSVLRTCSALRAEHFAWLPLVTKSVLYSSDVTVNVAILGCSLTFTSNGLFSLKTSANVCRVCGHIWSSMNGYLPVHGVFSSSSSGIMQQHGHILLFFKCLVCIDSCTCWPVWVIFNINAISNLPMKVKEIPLKWSDKRTQPRHLKACEIFRYVVDCWLLECSPVNMRLNSASDGHRSHRQHHIFLFLRRSLLINSNIKIKLWCFHVRAWKLPVSHGGSKNSQWKP